MLEYVPAFGGGWGRGREGHCMFRYGGGDFGYLGARLVIRGCGDGSMYVCCMVAVLWPCQQ